VVSSKSGHIFEQSVVEKYIESTGKCPVTGEPLDASDLLPLKSGGAVKPRPVAAASIPGMLSLFQNEWDALMLEMFTQKQQLESARQELGHALYQHDAACRVIARLITERDDARKALAEAKTAATNVQAHLRGANSRKGLLGAVAGATAGSAPSEPADAVCFVGARKSGRQYSWLGVFDKDGTAEVNGKPTYTMRSDVRAMSPGSGQIGRAVGAGPRTERVLRRRAQASMRMWCSGDGYWWVGAELFIGQAIGFVKSPLPAAAPELTHGTWKAVGDTPWLGEARAPPTHTHKRGVLPSAPRPCHPDDDGRCSRRSARSAASPSAPMRPPSRPSSPPRPSRSCLWDLPNVPTGSTSGSGRTIWSTGQW